jgi:hypothetical protein
LAHTNSETNLPLKKALGLLLLLLLFFVVVGGVVGGGGVVVKLGGRQCQLFSLHCNEWGKILSNEEFFYLRVKPPKKKVTIKKVKKKANFHTF